MSVAVGTHGTPVTVTGFIEMNGSTVEAWKLIGLGPAGFNSSLNNCPSAPGDSCVKNLILSSSLTVTDASLLIGNVTFSFAFVVGTPTSIYILSLSSDGIDGLGS